MVDETDEKTVSQPSLNRGEAVRKKHHSARQKRVKGKFVSTKAGESEEEVDRLTLLAEASVPALKQLIKLSKSKNEQVSLRAAKSVCELHQKSGYDNKKEAVSPVMQRVLDRYGEELSEEVNRLWDEVGEGDGNDDV